MKEILDSVSNPYSEENFGRLVDLFLNSIDDNEFYSSIVTYYQDRIDTGELQDSYIKTNFIRVESLPGWIAQRYFSEFFPTEHRIYINAPLNYIGTIVDKFVSECDTRNLPFELKYPTSHVERNDSIVIGSNTEAYKSHIEILRQIAKEHPEIVNECGTPPLLTGVLDGWMGLADENITNRYISYTQSRLAIFKRSVNKYLCSHLDLATQIGAENILETSKSIERILLTIDEEKLEGLDKKIELGGIEVYLDNTSLSLESKKKLAEYIERNPQVLGDIHKEFLDECEKKEIDSENSIFYKGSRTQLLENETSRKVSITDGLRDTIENATSTGLANMYLGSKHREYLSISSKVEILKNIFEKEIFDRRDAELVYKDLIFLGEIGFISNETVKDVTDSLYPEESIDCLNQFLETQEEVSEYFRYTKKPLKQLIKEQGEKISSEEIKQIIMDRKNYIVGYLTAPQLPVDQKEKRIQNDKDFAKQCSQDRFFPFKVTMLLEYQIELLEDDIEHSDERQEAGKRICAELQGKAQEDIDIDKVMGKIRQKISKPKAWDLDDW